MLFAFESGEAITHLGPLYVKHINFMIYFYLGNIIIIGLAAIFLFLN